MTAPLLTPRRAVDEIRTAPAAPTGARTSRRRRQAAAVAGALALAAIAAVGAGLATDGDEQSLRTVPGSAAGQEPVEAGPAVSQGTDLGHVTSFDGATIVLDRIEWLEHDDLVARQIEQGLDPAEALDFEIVDEQRDLHRYPVSPDAEVTLTVGLAPPDLQGGSVDSSLAELRTLLQDPAVGSAHLFEVTVEDGVVVGIAHRYVS